MNAAGVRIVVGSDGNIPCAPHVEMADTGTVEASKSADFLVLDANPVDDITNTRKISSVYLRGAAVDRPSYR